MRHRRRDSAPAPKPPERPPVRWGDILGWLCPTCGAFVPFVYLECPRHGASGVPQEGEEA